MEINLLRNKVKWLFNLEKEKVIIHNDIDGILSMAFLQNYANLKQIVGIYDLDCFYFSQKDYLKVSNFKNLIALDLDISFLGIRNIGHHMTCFNTNTSSLNINEEYLLTKDNIIDFYHKKYPLNTIILLYSLFGIEPNTDEEIALLIYADSVYKNYLDYKNNVSNWLKELNQYKILDALENRYDKLINIIISKIAPITNLYKDNRNNSKKAFSQCHITKKDYIYGKETYQYIGNPRHLLNLIKDITNWNLINLPNFLPYTRVCNNLSLSLGKDTKTIKENLFKFSNFLMQNNSIIVSHCLIYRNSIKITISKNDKKIEMINNEFKLIDSNYNNSSHFKAIG